MNSPVHLFIWLVIIAVYFIPAIIAWSRPAPRRGTVTMVNLFLGWTIVGWIVALAMAMRGPRPVP